MTITEHQDWLVDFYQRRNWYQYSPFVHLNFLTEETGEVSRAIRAIEIGRDHPGEKKATPEELRANLKEELADALDQVLVISSLYDIDAQDLLQASEQKLKQRFRGDMA
ncbi:MazG nucleotide pyrophosphohydrolase domain-containing protein [Levilactobacillus fujinensis]|uniref:MazG nucleotide pyrophosphohydrolase domain-containing protein n=1 Tax=Levilactobacillus fujinensis TaxID=2486024 RepID=A0ABW1TIG6_9LACO|nr:MazG nucleotide pyrophosphohydrolase domain-containing protein [Levilactobacillus fujinensis]